MYTYAQIQDAKVVGISYLSGEVLESDMINISGLGDLPRIGYEYDSTNNVFYPPGDYVLEPIPSIEEQILVENQYQTALLEMNMMGAN